MIMIMIFRFYSRFSNRIVVFVNYIIGTSVLVSGAGQLFKGRSMFMVGAASISLSEVTSLVSSETA